MSTLILTTKLYIPTPPPNVVPRPHLITRLNAASEPASVVLRAQGTASAEGLRQTLLPPVPKGSPPPASGSDSERLREAVAKTPAALASAPLTLKRQAILQRMDALGFKEFEDMEVYLEMRWSAHASVD